MRTLGAGERAVLAGAHLHIHARVDVQGADGLWVDVTALGGVDWFNKASWGEDLDQPVAGGTIELRREAAGKSLAPFMEASSLNQSGSPGGGYAPLLNAGRGVRIYTAEVAAGASPGSGDWRRVFEGKIDIVDWKGSESVVTLQVRDLGARLLDTFVEEPGDYGSEAGVPIETVIQQLLDDNATGVTLVTPVSPGWMLYVQPPEKLSGKNVYDAIRTLALEIGWDVRYRWGAGDAFDLTLYEPDRDAVAADTTFGPTEYLGITQLELSDADVRNVVVVYYVDAEGNEVPVERSDAASITQFGRRFLQIGQDASLGITTEAAAGRLADAVLADLAWPAVSHAIETLYFWPAQLGDVYSFAPNGVHYDASQRLASVTYRHELSEGHGTTTIAARGNPAGAYREWLRRAQFGPRTPRPGTAFEIDLEVLPSPDPVVYPESDYTHVKATASLAGGVVEFVAVRGGGATKDGGPAAGVASPSGTVWRFKRGAINTGLTQAEFLATSADGTATDGDFVTIDEAGRDTIRLTTKARKVSEDDDEITVRFYVADPYPQGASKYTVTWELVDVLSVAPASGQVMGLASVDGANRTVTSTLPPSQGAVPPTATGYIEFVVTRLPSSSDKVGRVIFTASAPGRVVDLDSIDVPSMRPTLGTVETVARVIPSPNPVTYPSDVYTFVEVTTVPDDALVHFVALRGAAVLDAGPAIGVAVASGQVWRFFNGTFGFGSSEAEFRGEKPGLAGASALATIPAIGQTQFPLTGKLVKLDAPAEATYVDVRFHVADPQPLGAGAYTVSYGMSDVPSVTPASGQVMGLDVADGPNRTVTSDLDATGFVQFRVGLPPSTQAAPGRVVFTVKAAKRLPFSVPIDVRPQLPETAGAGPEMTINMTVSGTYDTFAYTPSAGTSVFLSIDGGAFVAIPTGTGDYASPFILNRNAPQGATRAVTFRGIKNGRQVDRSFQVLPQDAGAKPDATIDELTPSTPGTVRLLLTSVIHTAGAPSQYEYVVVLNANGVISHTTHPLIPPATPGGTAHDIDVPIHPLYPQQVVFQIMDVQGNYNSAIWNIRPDATVGPFPTITLVHGGTLSEELLLDAVKPGAGAWADIRYTTRTGKVVSAPVVLPSLPATIHVRRGINTAVYVTLSVTDEVGNTRSVVHQVRSLDDADLPVTRREEDHVGSGVGGIARPGDAIHAIPITDATGGTWIVSPATSGLTPATLMPNGTSASTTEGFGNRAGAGLNPSGDVARGVPRGYAAADLPAINPTSGKLDGAVQLHGLGYYPVHNGQPVATLSNGATIEDYAGRAGLGLGAGTGVVNLDVPRAKAAANLPGLNLSTGKVDPAVPVSGSTGLPVHSGLPVSALSNGATIEDYAGRAGVGLASNGDVNRDVPRGKAAANLPGVNATTGKVDPTVPISGGTGLPVHTGLPVSSLLNGATVESEATAGQGAATRITDDVGSDPIESTPGALGKVAGVFIATVEQGTERGEGGLPAPGAAIDTVPVYDGTGGSVLVDPATGRMGTALGFPGGTSAATGESGVTKANAGLDTSGDVARDVPRARAAANLPAIKPASGKLDTTVAVDGSTATPIKSSDAVAALSNGATVEGNSARAGLGLATSGDVARDVPLTRAVANVPAINPSTGKLDATVAVNGSTATPVKTSDTVSALSGGATVASQASNGQTGYDRVNTLYAADGVLAAGVRQSDGSSTYKVIPKGVRSGRAKNTDVFTYSDTYQRVPTVAYTGGGATHQFGSKWSGTISDADANSGTGSGSGAPLTGMMSKQLFDADRTVSGFTARLRLAQYDSTGLQITRSSSGGATSTSSVGGTVGPFTMASYDQRYALRVTVTVTAGAIAVCRGYIQVAVMMALNGGAQVEVAQQTVPFDVSTGGSISQTFPIYFSSGAFDGAGGDACYGKIQAVVLSPGSQTPSYSLSVAANCWETTAGVSLGQQFASATPNGDADAIPFLLLSET